MGAQSALDAVITHRSELIGMTQAALGLMLHQLAIGDSQGAQLTYIEEHADADDLIGGMNADASAQIDIKRRKEELAKAALKFVEEVGVAVATHLLPLVLSMI
jgi:hypothetical protein